MTHFTCKPDVQVTKRFLFIYLFYFVLLVGLNFSSQPPLDGAADRLNRNLSWPLSLACALLPTYQHSRELR